VVVEARARMRGATKRAGADGPRIERPASIGVQRVKRCMTRAFAGFPDLLLAATRDAFGTSFRP
jgi:hypothetical protein